MKRMTKYYEGWRQLDYPMDSTSDKQKLLKCMLNTRRYRRQHKRDITTVNVIIRHMRKELGNEEGGQQ